VLDAVWLDYFVQEVWIVAEEKSILYDVRITDVSRRLYSLTKPA